MQTWDMDRASFLIQELEQLPGALLPILHALQDEFGYVDQAAVPLIADALNISEAEVHGVISFYHDFRQYSPWTPCLKIAARKRASRWVAKELIAACREQAWE